jgi:hypothetical protein
MWQRFTERSRRVVFFAQEEAVRLGENYVSTEHLLLGLTRESDSVAARVLDRMGVSLERLRNEVERNVARGDGRVGQDMQLTPRAKRVIDLAHDEARSINNNYIGTEHLLLGLIREGEGLAGRIFNKLGIEVNRTRLEVINLQDTDPRTPKDPDQSAAREAMRQEVQQRIGRGGTPEEAELRPLIGTEYGDLGVVKAPGGRTHVEVAFDAAAFVQLVNIFRARDTHGYRAMSHGDQTMLLVPNGTPLKLLVPPAGGEAASGQGYYVRVLSGVYEGYAGWMFAHAFERTGPDEAPFPPETED